MILAAESVTLSQMAKHLIRNFLGITILYVIIIFGIFALQFRSESSFLQNFGSLTLHLVHELSQDGSNQADTVLKNDFTVSGNGLSLFANEENPLLLHAENDEMIPLTLQGWQENSQTSFSLFFSEDVTLSFLSFETGFDIIFHRPIQNSHVTIPYKTTINYESMELSGNQVTFNLKTDILSLQADQTTSNTLIVSSSKNAFVQVSPYEETPVFSLDAIIGHEDVSEQTLEVLISQMKGKIVRDFDSVQSDNLSEKFVAAYIAELAEQGRYAEALNNIPTSFINGTERTYFTTPYFNSLVRMNATLVAENESVATEMRASLSNSTLDIFESDNFPFYLLQQTSATVTPILSLPARLSTFDPTYEQAVGILATYIQLLSVQPTSAELLQPVLESCITVIKDMLLELQISPSYVSDSQNIEKVFLAKTGRTLLSYGEITSQTDLQTIGRMLLITVLQNSEALDSETLALIYPYIVVDNTFYPHAEVLAYENGKPIWSWNIAQSIDCYKDADGTLFIDIEFPQTQTYHMILHGIEPFRFVEIYNLRYATDPLFETYNAPGYIYQAQTETLLLKYRQRDPIEQMRLIYN
ncbi:MAG: hypothetical protein R3Y36_02525 [Spirochaetales bacterium]